MLANSQVVIVTRQLFNLEFPQKWYCRDKREFWDITRHLEEKRLPSCNGDVEACRRKSLECGFKSLSWRGVRCFGVAGVFLLVLGSRNFGPDDLRDGNHKLVGEEGQKVITSTHQHTPTHSNTPVLERHVLGITNQRSVEKMQISDPSLICTSCRRYSPTPYRVTHCGVIICSMAGMSCIRIVAGT